MRMAGHKNDILDCRIVTLSQDTGRALGNHLSRLNPYCKGRKFLLFEASANVLRIINAAVRDQTGRVRGVRKQSRRANILRRSRRIRNQMQLKSMSGNAAKKVANGTATGRRSVIPEQTSGAARVAAKQKSSRAIIKKSSNASREMLNASTSSILNNVQLVKRIINYHNRSCCQNNGNCNKQTKVKRIRNLEAEQQKLKKKCLKTKQNFKNNKLNAMTKKLRKRNSIDYAHGAKKRKTRKTIGNPLSRKRKNSARKGYTRSASAAQRPSKSDARTRQTFSAKKLTKLSHKSENQVGSKKMGWLSLCGFTPFIKKAINFHCGTKPKVNNGLKKNNIAKSRARARRKPAPNNFDDEQPCTSKQALRASNRIRGKASKGRAAHNFDDEQPCTSKQASSAWKTIPSNDASEEVQPARRLFRIKSENRV